MAAQLLLLIAFNGGLKVGAASGVRRMPRGRPDWPAARGVGMDRVGGRFVGYRVLELRSRTTRWVMRGLRSRSRCYVMVLVSTIVLCR